MFLKSVCMFLVFFRLTQILIRSHLEYEFKVLLSMGVFPLVSLRKKKKLKPMPNCYSLNIKEHLKLILTLYTFFLITTKIFYNFMNM